MAEIAIPRMSSNDDFFTLRSWAVASGARVEAGTVIAVVEDSKTAIEVVSEAAGVLQQRAEVGKEYPVGHVIALVRSEGDASESRQTSEAAATTKVVITNGAREAMAELGVDEAAVIALGRPVVRRSDIEEIHAGKAAKAAPAARPAGSGTPLPKHQIAVSRVVAASHRTIPKAFLLVKARCDELLKRVQGKPFGMTEVVVRILADLAERFPDCYSRFDEETVIRPDEEINVGVTFDLGKGLFVPVVRGADEAPPAKIAEALKGFREHAMAGRFPEGAVLGGHITLALNPGEGIVFSLPMIFPGQACIVALGSVTPEVVPLESGFGVAQMVHLGLAYDHRIVNGSYAVDFMSAVRRQIEFPGTNRWL